MILLAVILTLLTVAIHCAATLCVMLRFARRDREGSISYASDSPLRAVVGIALLVTFMLLVNLVEAGVWASACYWSRRFSEASTAFDFSLASSTTVGYGDVVLDRGSRLLGPIESVVGVLMMGWSTAIIVNMVQKTHHISKS